MTSSHLTEVLELWREVSRLLKENNIDSVLVGGAVATVYTQGKYETKDLDLVIDGTHEEVRMIMTNNHFKKCNGYYLHEDYAITIDFITGYLEIGYDCNLTPVIDSESGLKILTPTDCIKDRLSSFLYQEKGPENERKGLNVARLIATKHTIDKNEVKNWCKGEGAEEVYNKLF